MNDYTQIKLSKHDVSKYPSEFYKGTLWKVYNGYSM